LDKIHQDESPTHQAEPNGRRPSEKKFIAVGCARRELDCCSLNSIALMNQPARRRRYFQSGQLTSDI